MDSISEKFGKYLVQLSINNHSYFFVWGINLESEEEFLLIDKKGKIILFQSLDALKKYIILNSHFLELINWANTVNDDEKIINLSINVVGRIKAFKLLTINDKVLWEEIALLIELCDDLIYLKQVDSKLVTNQEIFKFKEQYNDNFVWKNEIKADFKINDCFIKSLRVIAEYLIKNCTIVD